MAMMLAKLIVQARLEQLHYMLFPEENQGGILPFRALSRSKAIHRPGLSPEKIDFSQVFHE